MIYIYNGVFEILSIFIDLNAHPFSTYALYDIITKSNV